jgi:hypothetical protein
MKKFLGIALVVVMVVIAIGGYVYPKVQLGANPGPSHYNKQFFQNGIVVGGSAYASSTANSAETMTGKELDDEIVLDYTLNVQDATLTLPASTTAMFSSNIPKTGDTMTRFIRNATTTATMDLTIAAGSGVLLKKATTTAVIYGDADGASYARLDFIRKSNKDVEALLTIYGD